MNVYLCKYSRKSKLLCQKYKSNPTPETKKRYQDYRNTLNKLKKFEWSVYYKNLFEKCCNDSKATWCILNRLMCKSSNRLRIPRLLVDNSMITDESKISNCVNNHFATAGKKVQSKITKVNVDPLKYLQRNRESLTDILCSEIELIKIVMQMKSKKSSGFDGITDDFLKKYSCLSERR